MITMHVPQSIQERTKIATLRISLRDWHELLLKSMSLTNLIATCIGVMHIVDMYASCMQNQVSLSLLKGNPEYHPLL
jgi:hypothetical protein